MDGAVSLILFLGVPSLLLALPAFLRSGAKEGLLASLKALFVLVLPAVFFLFSVEMVPEWKGGARAGWLDGFHEGKLALSPYVVWALVAAWTQEVWRPATAPRWVVLGYFAGFFASAVCLAIGLFIEGGDTAAMIVPLYTPMYFGLRTLGLYRQQSPGAPATFWTLLAGFPQLGTGLMWAHWVYEQLPDDPPDCFVVTAASRGHRAVVGPLERIEREGRPRWANQQLQDFWAFEARWSARHPASHAAVRGLYNRIGPIVARQIRSPLLADLVFLALWPLQQFVRRR
jgi:hypothetical protein